MSLCWNAAASAASRSGVMSIGPAMSALLLRPVRLLRRCGLLRGRRLRRGLRGRRLLRGALAGGRLRRAGSSTAAAGASILQRVAQAPHLALELHDLAVRAVELGARGHAELRAGLLHL